MRRTAVVLVLMVMAAALPVVRGVAKDAPGVPDAVEADDMWGEALTPAW